MLFVVFVAALQQCYTMTGSCFLSIGSLLLCGRHFQIISPAVSIHISVLYLQDCSVLDLAVSSFARDPQLFHTH